MMLTNLPDAGLMREATDHWYNSGVLRIIYGGVKSNLFPCLIFMGVGAMTDFSPLIANPVSLLLGSAKTNRYLRCIYDSYCFRVFTSRSKASIGIIGGADGPTAIFTTSQLAPKLLAPIAVGAYSYMALIPIIQPPIMKALTTKKKEKLKWLLLEKYQKLKK